MSYFEVGFLILFFPMTILFSMIAFYIIFLYPLAIVLKIVFGGSFLDRILDL